MKRILPIIFIVLLASCAAPVKKVSPVAKNLTRDQVPPPPPVYTNNIVCTNDCDPGPLVTNLWIHTVSWTNAGSPPQEWPTNVIGIPQFDVHRTLWIWEQSTDLTYWATNGGPQTNQPPTFMNIVVDPTVPAMFYRWHGYVTP